MVDGDIRLVRGLKSGDAGAMAELVQRHYRALFEVHWLLHDDVNEAGRLTRETFAEAWRCTPEPESYQSLRAWLLALAIRQLHGRPQATHRSDQAGRRMPGPPDSVADGAWTQPREGTAGADVTARGWDSIVDARRGHGRVPAARRRVPNSQPTAERGES